MGSIMQSVGVSLLSMIKSDSKVSIGGETVCSQESVTEFWLSPTGRPDDVVINGQDVGSGLSVSIGIFLIISAGKGRGDGFSAMIAIGRSYGAASASVFLRGGEDGQLHARGRGGGRGAAIAIPADCEAGADVGGETVRPAEPERAVDRVRAHAVAPGAGNSAGSERGAQFAGVSAAWRGGEPFGGVHPHHHAVLPGAPAEWLRPAVSGCGAAAHRGNHAEAGGVAAGREAGLGRGGAAGEQCGDAVRRVVPGADLGGRGKRAPAGGAAPCEALGPARREDVVAERRALFPRRRLAHLQSRADAVPPHVRDGPVFEHISHGGGRAGDHAGAQDGGEYGGGVPVAAAGAGNVPAGGIHPGAAARSRGRANCVREMAAGAVRRAAVSASGASLNQKGGRR